MIRKKGRFYTVNGERVKAKDFVSRSMFKWWNFIHKWAVEGDKKALDTAERILEERYLKLGIKMGRTWYDYEFWRQVPSDPNPDFWDTPTNYKRIINLHAVPDDGFKLSELEKKTLKKGLQIALKHGFFFNHTFAATIKHYESWAGDPRHSQEWTNTWLGHYFVKLGTYLKELREELGSLPCMFEFVNEYDTVSPRLSFPQIAAMCQRFHVRGPTGELVGMDCGGPIFSDKTPRPYPVFSKDGPAWNPDDIRFHPPRDREVPWWRIAEYIEKSNLPIYMDEPILLMPKKAYAALPKSHWWRYGGTHSKSHYAEMLESLWAEDVYTCIHDGGSDDGSRHGGGISAGWVPGFNDKSGEIDMFIMEVLGTLNPPPPPLPPPDPEPEKSWWEKLVEILKGVFNYAMDEKGIEITFGRASR